MNVIETLLASAMLAAAPLMLAAIGEAIGQRSGQLNLGVEGVMLLGAFTGFVVVEAGGTVSAGLVAAMIIGMVVGAGFGLATTLLSANQIVLGLGVALAGEGATGYLFRERFGLSQPLLDAGMSRPLHHFAGIPVVGPALFDQRWFVYLAWALVVGIGAWMRYGRPGLILRAAGESPFATEAAGVDVQRVRVIAAIVGQGLVGLGGGALSLVEVGFFTPGMTVGIGFIAIAIAMVGQQRPLRIAGLAIVFGLLRGSGTAIQLTNVDVQTEFLELLPYAGVLVLVVLMGRQVRLPRALGLAYDRESRNA